MRRKNIEYVLHINFPAYINILDSVLWICGFICVWLFSVSVSDYECAQLVNGHIYYRLFSNSIERFGSDTLAIFNIIDSKTFWLIKIEIWKQPAWQYFKGIHCVPNEPANATIRCMHTFYVDIFIEHYYIRSSSIFVPFRILYIEYEQYMVKYCNLYYWALKKASMAVAR